MNKLPQSRFRLVFSLLMAAMVVFLTRKRRAASSFLVPRGGRTTYVVGLGALMTFVITTINVGWPVNFMRLWAQAFVVAYCVAVPVIYFLAPLARRLTARFVHLL